MVIKLKGVFELFITYNFYADSQADKIIRFATCS